jgi:membrane fusion protein, heavy metal efflux system
MRVDLDDVHSDSLSGAALSAPALSVPPSLRPAPPSKKLLRLGGGLASLLIAGAAFAGLRGDPELRRTDLLRVEGHNLNYSEGFAARAGIHTVEVKEAAFSPIVSAIGKTAFDPSEVAAVDANALGTVRRVVRYEGESVKRGDVLAEIGSPGLARIEAASFMRAHAGAPDASHALGVSVVRSPLEGTVIERRIVTGQSVSGERVVFVVANLDRLSLDLQVDENEARALGVGDRVELSRESTGAVIDGQVAQVGSEGAAGSGKPLVVRVEVDNRNRQLRPGQAVSAKIYASGGARALVIPNRAVAWIAGHPSVFIERGHNSVSAWPVTLGGCNGDQTEVSVGLAAGQHIVSDGVAVLKDESFL